LRQHASSFNTAQLHHQSSTSHPRASVSLQVRDWYVESFKELRTFPHIRDANDELKFTELLRHIYRRHANVVPVMAKVGGFVSLLKICPGYLLVEQLW
jgi:hypothetical protein